MYYFLLLTAAFLFFTGCMSEQKPAEPDKDLIKKEVKAEFDKLVTSLNALNADGWSDFYSKEGFISATAGIDHYKDRSEWVEDIKKYFATRGTQQVDVLDLEITPLSNDLALMTSKEKTLHIMQDSSEIKGEHVFSMLWKKEEGGWKILHSHESWKIEQ